MNKFQWKIERAVEAFRHKIFRKNGIHLSKLSNVQRVSKYCYQERNTCNVRQWVLRRGHWQLPNFSQMRPKGGHEEEHHDQATRWNGIDIPSFLKWSFPFWIRCHWVSCTERWRSSACTRPKCPRVRGWHTCRRKSRFRHPASKGRI